MDIKSLADHVVVVLVEPQQSGNIGAVARAMKNMGLRDLVIVNPPAYDPEQARWMAPGCADLLASARIVATLDEGLASCHWAVATTARHRRHDQPTYEPSALADEVITGLSNGRRVALVFGREDHGLSVDEVSRCEAILWIPTPEHASLNLAQAVLLVAHSIFERFREHGGQATGRTLGEPWNGEHRPDTKAAQQT